MAGSPRSAPMGHLAPDPPVHVPRGALALVFTVAFLDLLGASLLAPIMPYLVVAFGGDALAVGLLTTAFSAAQFLATPALGALSDRFGRRPVLLVSILGSGLAYLLFGFANALWVLFAAQLLNGVTGANLSAAQAYLADVSRPQDRAKMFGLLGAVFGLGFILGPVAGGLLGRLGLAVPAFLAGALC